MKVASLGPRVLDLGCGTGSSIDLFKRILPGSAWTGVDIEASPEVNGRTRTDGTFVSYDGEYLPFEDASFDLVFFEHLRFPEKLLAEVTRVLAPGGRFIGSTSALEPHHSYSYWCFTPWGFRVLLEDAGMKLERMAPGIDSLTLSPTSRSTCGSCSFADSSCSTRCAPAERPPRRQDGTGTAARLSRASRSSSDSELGLPNR